MSRLESLSKQSTILRDIFERHPEALEVFQNDEVKFRVVLEGAQQCKFFVEIWNSKKRVSFACKNNNNIEVFVNDLKLELADLGIDLFQSRS